MRSGSTDLAAHRADLVFLKRGTIGHSGFRCGGWRAGWPEVFASQAPREDNMKDISFDDNTEEFNDNADDTNDESSRWGRQRIRNAALKIALTTEQAFFEAYESTTALNLALYVLKERRRAAEAVTADIAATRFLLRDYPAAASYFRQLTPFYAKSD